MSGFFLGKEIFLVAVILLLMRITGKLAISEFMYKRMQAVVHEEGEKK